MSRTARSNRADGRRQRLGCCVAFHAAQFRQHEPALAQARSGGDRLGRHIVGERRRRDRVEKPNGVVAHHPEEPDGRVSLLGAFVAHHQVVLSLPFAQLDLIPRLLGKIIAADFQDRLVVDNDRQLPPPLGGKDVKVANVHVDVALPCRDKLPR